MKFENMNMNQANDYVMKHGVKMPNGQVCLLEPLYVYKKISNNTGSDAIANLIIPVGAFVNLATGTGIKFRASEAITYSIVSRWNKIPTDIGYAKHSQGGQPAYKYYSALDNGISEEAIAKAAYNTSKQGKARFHKNKDKKSIAIPRYDFDTTTMECRSGIHFFLDQKRALAY